MVGDRVCLLHRLLELRPTIESRIIVMAVASDIRVDDLVLGIANQHEDGGKVVFVVDVLAA